MSRTVSEINPVRDEQRSSFFWSYQVVVPADSTIHPLNEIGFGYFVAVEDPVGSDRAVRSIKIFNTQPIDGGLDVYVGCGWIAPLACTDPILPRTANTYEVDKLSGLALQNVSAVTPITVVISLIATDV